MGQPVRVVSKREIRPGVVRYEIDRSLTGTDHELYLSSEQAVGDRPPDLLASRLFEMGQMCEIGRVRAVHVFSNVLTITLESGGSTGALDEVVQDLFIHYRPGVVPTVV